jgi:polar amino acid transport system permease protein
MTAEVFLPVAAHLWRGLMATLWVSLLSTLLASAAGIALGVLAQSRQRWLAWPVRWYVEVFRGVPSLLTLLFVFFALPQAGLATSPVAASVIGLGLWGSAGVSEIARGALASIPAQQSEGARALGMGALEATVHVVLPRVFAPKTLSPRSVCAGVT